MITAALNAARLCMFLQLIKMEVYAMRKFVCDICGYIYEEEFGDPEHDITPGTKWEELPDDFVCPLCGVGKDMFSEEL